MQSRCLHEDAGQRTYVVVLETSDEVMECLTRFIREQSVSAAQITAIGAFSGVVPRYFDWETKKYDDIPVSEQVEVASLMGDVAESPDGNPSLHIHLVVARRDGTAMAGHLGKGHVRPTLEVILTESPIHLRKRKDDESGLALIQPES
jgi:predicted DNA-binding protein with PD1-like motif